MSGFGIHHTGGISIPRDTHVAFQGKEMPIAMKEEEPMKRNNSAMSLRKLVPKLLRSNSMKNLFKHKKPRAPLEIVRDTRRMLLYVHSESDEASPKHSDKVFSLSIHAFASSSFTYDRMFWSSWMK